jgi:DNA-binding transcriptional ArsR family regulator
MIDKAIHAITEPRRRDILYLIRNEELTSSAIASHFEITPPAISQHLKVLEEAGLVILRREGTKRLYSIRREGFSELRQYIDSYWNDSLMRLKEAAEQEERRKHESNKQK